MQVPSRRASRQPMAFTLVEMLVVIAIISILMTAGTIGLSGVSGKGVTSGVATAEAIFDEARSTAVGRNLRSCVLVAKTLTDSPADDLRRMVIATEEVETDPVKANFGQAKDPTNPSPMWELSSRGALLPDQTFFSQILSKLNQVAVTEAGTESTLPEITDSKIKAVKAAFKGSYWIYQFNSQGICALPGSSFVIGSGSRSLSKPSTDAPPRVTGSSKRDFGGFVIWRNGRTSVFRSPEQMGEEVKSIQPGDPF